MWQILTSVQQTTEIVALQPSALTPREALSVRVLVHLATAETENIAWVSTHHGQR